MSLKYIFLSTDRLERMKKKYRLLMHDSHNNGAGDVRDSEKYIKFRDIYNAVKKELERRENKCH